MKKYDDKLREYEKRKQKLIMTCSTQEELNRKLRELIKELKI